MARIIGGIASSHTPTIGFALDAHKQADPTWAPIFEGYRPVRQWLAEKRPDVLVLIFNDHVTSFFFDHYPQFALGIGESYAVADEGGGPRDLPPVPGHAALSHHIAAGLVADEFDLSYFQDKALDHGCFSPLSMLWPRQPADRWPGAIVPLQIGVLQFPIPSARRCYRLGQSLRRAIHSYPEELGVVIVATGGLSHQVHGERCGFNNVAWDHRFLELIQQDPEQLTRMTHAEYAELGGLEGAEVIMWLVMRGALSPRVTKRHHSYYLPSMTGIATAIYEDQEPVRAPDPEYLAHVNRQLAGIEKLEGTYPFTLARSVTAYRLNKFLHGLIDPDRRALFRSDQEAAFTAAGLTGEERELVRRRDWRGMIHYGVSFFMLEKLGAVVGVSNLHIYAAMRGQTLEAFQQTRNAPGALYSVAGTDTTGPLTWDTPVVEAAAK
jgi:gallate dioxygenase